MAFITVSQGRPNVDIQPGVYPVTLVEISDPREVVAQRGPRAGETVSLIDWTFALDNGVEIEASTSTASGPRSKMFAFLTALFGGQAPPIGTQLEKEHLIGRQALATIQMDESGWPRIMNLGAIPNTMPLPQPQAPLQPVAPVVQAAPQPPVAPTDNSAVVAARQRAPRRQPPASEAPIYNAQGLVPGTGPRQPVAVAAAPGAGDRDLPF